MTPRIKKIMFICLLIMTGIIGGLHYATPGHLMLFHDTFRRLSYFPIVIGGILYGVRGGLLMALLSCLSFVPHLLTFWYQGPEAYYSELSEILFYLAAGIAVGWISGRETRMREAYKAQSEQLAASYQRLHHQATRLVQAEKELGQAARLSLLGHVSASLAHEIKNPLAAIKGAAEILAEEVSPAHPKHEFVDIMRSEINRLDNSVEEVLSYCRGQKTQETQEMALVRRVIRQVIQVVSPGVKNKGGTIIRQAVRDEADQVLVPLAGFTQVLMNLFVNALDEIPEQDGLIRISVKTAVGRSLILVEDNGPGLDTATCGAVFKSFVTFKAGGTGLGLSISDRIVRGLGGTITAGSSIAYGGACFTIELPRAKGETNR